MVEVRWLGLADAPAYREVRLAALHADPAAFITTAEEFASQPLETVEARLTGEASVTFGAFVGGELAGILTVARETRERLRHRANVFGVAVLPAARGQGCGDALLRAGIAEVQGWTGVTSLHLGVTASQAAARRLYERHGFVAWGIQPDAVWVDGIMLAEVHMVREMGAAL